MQFIKKKTLLWYLLCLPIRESTVWGQRRPPGSWSSPRQCGGFAGKDSHPWTCCSVGSTKTNYGLRNHGWRSSHQPRQQFRCIITSMAHHVGFIWRYWDQPASVPTGYAAWTLPLAAGRDVDVLCRTSVTSSSNDNPVTVSFSSDDGTADIVTAVVHGAVPWHGLPGVGTDYVLVGVTVVISAHAVDPVIALISDAAATVHDLRVVGHRNPAFLLRPAVNLVVLNPVVPGNGIRRSSVSDKLKVGATEERLR